jgi:hypothetical protein
MTRVTRRRSVAAGVLTSCLVLTAACGDDDNEPETLPSDGDGAHRKSPELLSEIPHPGLLPG